MFDAPSDESAVADLPMVERVLLWSMRAWVVGLHQPEAGVAGRIAATFLLIGVPGGEPGIDGLMRALRGGASRTIGVQCPCRTTVDPDERRLLDVVALAQHGEPLPAKLILRSLVAQADAEAAYASAASLARNLRLAGYELPEVEGAPVTQFAWADDRTDDWAGSARPTTH